MVIFTMKTHKTVLKNQPVFFMSVGGQNLLNPAMPVQALLKGK